MDPPNAHDQKAAAIVQACDARDYHELATLATSSDGFLTDELRRTAWPFLLGCVPEHSKETVPWDTLPTHRDEEQVKLDVDRSFVFYPRNQSEKQLDNKKKELSDLITEVLRRHPSLCYFQGYHDIAQVLLLVLGADKAPPAVARISLLRIRDFMLPTLAAAVAHLELILPLIHSVDPVVSKRIAGIQPYYALGAMLTLYAHDIEEYGSIARLFDFLLAKEAVISVYLFAVIILRRKEELLDIPLDEQDILQFTLSKLPKPLDMEGLISETVDLSQKHPPETLSGRAWRRISSYSVLKTTRDPIKLAEQTLEDGEQLLKKQAAQQAAKTQREQLIRRFAVPIKKFAQKSKFPLQFTTIAVAIAVLSWCLGRGNNSSYFGLIKTPFDSIAALFGRY